ncbi:MAG: PmoA family protein [Saprospiraceae bacterium]
MVAKQPGGFFIGQGKDSVLFYQRIPHAADGRYARAHYIHPLYSLHNTVLTENMPKDHPHHHGVFWAWHQNFVGETSVGDAWALENFSWEVAKAEVDRSASSCVLRTEVLWKSPLWLDENGKEKAFVREKTDIAIHRSKENYRVIDFRIELHALEAGFQIGGSTDEKGYSGFSWRIRLPDELTFAGARGEVQPQNLALDAGPWMNITGNLDGQAGNEGVLVIDHPGNPGYPQPWILRSKNSMQNAAFPGREKIEIKPDQPLLLRYRMVIYDGALSRAQIDRLSASM